LDRCLPTLLAATAAIRQHDELILSDSAFDAFIHPTRDGLSVARRNGQ
jgi:hypothetical protein